jgi:hypothetical protein
MRISEAGVTPRCIEIQKDLADAKVRTPNQDIPHQSKLGNSSNLSEMPRQAYQLMAGPAPQGVDSPSHKADYKD